MILEKNRTILQKTFFETRLMGKLGFNMNFIDSKTKEAVDLR
jgi:hypothetical protein